MASRALVLFVFCFVMFWVILIKHMDELGWKRFAVYSVLSFALGGVVFYLADSPYGLLIALGQGGLVAALHLDLRLRDFDSMR